MVQTTEEISTEQAKAAKSFAIGSNSRARRDPVKLRRPFEWKGRPKKDSQAVKERTKACKSKMPMPDLNFFHLQNFRKAEKRP